MQTHLSPAMVAKAKGPIVFLDYDKDEIDFAYDQHRGLPIEKLSRQRRPHTQLACRDSRSVGGGGRCLCHGLQSVSEAAATPARRTSPKGNPELKSLRSVLRAMGMQLTVRPRRKRVA